MKFRVHAVEPASRANGPGIRAVIWFQGCPLHCPWCSNPESRSREAAFIRREAKCIHCGTCALDVDECPSGAYPQMGTEYTLDELMAEVMKDEVFFRVSGGGVTLSGGEVLSQAAFATRLLKRLKALGIATAVETTGHGSRSALLEMAKHSDEVLYDFKIMDAKRAHEVTGINLKRALDSFAALCSQGSHVIPRLPLIPGYTMTMENLERVLEFLAPFGLHELHLLPFHQYGANKYKLVGLDYAMADIPPPAEEEVEPYVRRAKAA